MKRDTFHKLHNHKRWKTVPPIRLRVHNPRHRHPPDNQPHDIQFFLTQTSIMLINPQHHASRPVAVRHLEIRVSQTTTQSLNIGNRPIA